MGIAQTKELPWSEAEVAILERWGHLTDIGIQTKLAKAAFHRSLTAIHLKVTRLRIKKNLDGYSATGLSKAFGVDGHTVIRWINRGLLKAERRGSTRVDAQHGDTYWITNNEVKQFIQAYPNEVDLGKVEKFWFLDLVTGGAISENTAEIGRLRSQVSALIVAAQETTKSEKRKLKALQETYEALYKPKIRQLQAGLAGLDEAIDGLQGNRVTREDARLLHDLVARFATVLRLSPEAVAKSTVASDSVENFVSAVMGLGALAS
jgi:hypothetical protein